MSTDRPAQPSYRLVQYAPRIVGALLTLLAATLYILTLAPSVMPGDYAEFQFSAAILGVPHPTGYPLYVMLGKLFTLLPFGDVAYRVNLSSAIYMAGAVGLLYATGVKLLRLLGWGRAWWAASVGAVLFAASPTTWSMALVARSYALNALLVGCVVYSLISWRETRRSRWFYASLLFIGLSVVHHGTTYFLLPAYGLYLLFTEYEIYSEHNKRNAASGTSTETQNSKLKTQNSWKRWLLGTLSLALGLSPIFFLVYRFLGGSPYYWGNPATWKDFFTLLTGGPFQSQVLGYGTDLSAQLSRIAFGTGELSNQFTPVGIAAGLLGLALLWRFRWREAGLLTLMMLANFGFSMNYALVGYLYFIPTYLLWGVFISIAAGFAANLLLGRVTGAPAQKNPRAFRGGAGGVATGIIALAGIAIAAALAFALVERYPALDQSGQTQTRDQTLALLNSAPPGSTLYLDWEELSAVRYFRYVYGMRSDLTLHSGDPSDWAEAIYCDIANGATPFVGNFAGSTPPDLTRDFTLQPAPMTQRVTGVTNAALYQTPACGTCATCR